MCRQVPSFAPTTISPRGTRSVSAISLRMVLRRSSVSSAYLKNSLPDAVSETRPPERSSRRAPTSSSRARIWEEIAGWVRKRFSAAREKLERRATSLVKDTATDPPLHYREHEAITKRIETWRVLDSTASLRPRHNRPPEQWVIRRFAAILGTRSCAQNARTCGICLSSVARLPTTASWSLELR